MGPRPGSWPREGEGGCGLAEGLTMLVGRVSLDTFELIRGLGVGGVGGIKPRAVVGSGIVPQVNGNVAGVFNDALEGVNDDGTSF